jgi:hypothetical protein
MKTALSSLMATALRRYYRRHRPGVTLEFNLN